MEISACIPDEMHTATSSMTGTHQNIFIKSHTRPLGTKSKVGADLLASQRILLELRSSAALVDRVLAGMQADQCLRAVRTSSMRHAA